MLEQLQENRNDVSDVQHLISRSREAQSSWRMSSPRTRLGLLRSMRNRIAENPRSLLDAIRLTRSGASDSEALISEVLPFLDAIRFLESNAERLLRIMHRDNASRPFWLSGVSLEVHREPFGVVLIIGSSNYPLFLPGVQMVQALASGNTVLIKPGRNASPAMLALRNYFDGAGFPANLITILDESPQTAADCIAAGLDKIWLTGSAETGRAVAKIAAEKLTPMVCELSGCDALIVLPGADPALAARAIAFGLKLNDAQTCMRPHRVLVHQGLEAEFRHELLLQLARLRIRTNPTLAARLQSLSQVARRQGAVQLQGSYNGETMTPFIIADVGPDSELWNADIFAPVVALTSFATIKDAVQLHNTCRYGLTVSVFGPEEQARLIATQLDAGTVVINDVIVPTADPRLPFSGRKQSGYGVTRGDEGLLEFTRAKAISVRHSGYHHLEAPHASDAAMFSGFVAALHGHGLLNRLRGTLNSLFAAVRRNSGPSRRALHD